MNILQDRLKVESFPQEIKMYPPETEWEIHPLANAFPMHSEDEFKALCKDIHAKGQQEPIKICRGRIIDGRNRYKACKKLGLEIKAIEVEIPEERIEEYALSLNLHRRNLNPGQRAVIALKDWDKVEREARNRMRGQGACGKNSTGGRVVEILAKKYFTNAKYIQWAKEIQEKKPELLDGVLDGTKKIGHVYSALKTSRRSAKSPPKINIPVFIFQKLVEGVKVKELLPHMPKQAKEIAEKALKKEASA